MKIPTFLNFRLSTQSTLISTNGHQPIVPWSITFAILLLVGLGRAQLLPAQTPLYRITTLGFTDSDHTRDDGYRFSSYRDHTDSGFVIGRSGRWHGNTGMSAWIFDGTNSLRIGLAGNEHTRLDSQQISSAEYLNESGAVVGQSNRYNGGADDLGKSAWIYDGTSTIEIGLGGVEHTRDDGYQYNDVSSINESGRVVGFTHRFNGGSNSFGSSAWIYDGTSTTSIGLTGTEHTTSWGGRNSTASQNDSGLVFGRSNRYGGGTGLGVSAWIYDGTNTTNIGLTGSEYTRFDGYKASLVNGHNELGTVVGWSLIYNGGSEPLGYSSWTHNGTERTSIGLVGQEHTSSDGITNNFPRSINASGSVIGRGVRYSGGSMYAGGSAWQFDGTTTRDISLTGSEHTRDDGFRDSNVLKQSNSGFVIGFANRYAGNAENGESAWIYNGVDTQKIGLAGTAFTRSDGYQYSRALIVNESGLVVGQSTRYGTDGNGAWLYDGTSTVEIGLSGSGFTGSNGAIESDISSLNEVGQVIGYSTRYDADSSNGQSGWFFDSSLQQTIELIFSIRSSDDYAFSRPTYLSEDGMTLGYYKRYDSADNYLGDYAFYFTMEYGMHDLGSLVDGGLATYNWERLGRLIGANGIGQFIGYGQLIDSSDQSVYLLTPIPEPSAILLGAFASIGLCLRRRRAKMTFQTLSLPIPTP